MFTIFIKLNETMTFSEPEISQTMTVEQLIGVIKRRTRDPTGDYALFYLVKALQPQHTLESYGVRNNSTIHASKRGRGGDSCE